MVTRRKKPTGAQAQLDALAKRAAKCTNCPLYEHATQTVFGEGSVNARLMIVGEQPGDMEDREGHPFVGPAGRILDQALQEAGIPRELAYVTNVVKHFKWEPRGKRRMHKTPAQREIDACFQWLEGEMEVVKPRAIVALGATAAKALLGARFRISTERGRVQSREGLPDVVPTWHPSYLLRLKDRPGGDEARAEFVSDLRTAAQYLVPDDSGR
ncbi:MAG TPA: UdgX family uracil-DNA binding protein [Usitatibacter sp.]|jgi:DNA polymerase|nr:UdgX family uracil-DNA binding protein [Usitatibacter sp.]